MSTQFKDDPDVKIPAAVKAAAERSNQLHEMYRDKPEGEEPPAEGTEGQTEEGGEEDGQSGVTSQGNPETDPKKLAENQNGDQNDGQNGRDEQRKAEQRETPPQGNENPDEWEHKYKSLHGRYVQSQQQMRHLQESVANLQGVIATMQQGAEKSSGPPELDPENLLTPEEMNDYGEDFLKVVGKRARQEMAPVIDGYKKEIEKLQQQLHGVSGDVQKTKTETLHTQLDKAAPDWRKLNQDPNFLEWLSLPDVYSGAIRHDMLKNAYTQGDVHRVANFFNGFLSQEATVAPANKAPDEKGNKNPKVPLQDLAAPGRAKTAATNNTPAEKPIITRAQIAAFYADVSNGEYRGRDDEKNKAEAEIFAAQRDGRIR